jgi:hypothetical protein
MRHSFVLVKLCEQVTHLEGLGEAILLVHVDRLDAFAEAEDHRVVLVLRLSFAKHLRSYSSYKTLRAAG